jgi:impB/mucB/samB family C-terminal domain
LQLSSSLTKKPIVSDEQVKRLLQRCRGVDTVSITDDDGEAPKTISVENSFRRSTVVTPEAVWRLLEQLYVRLPRLLKDRRDWSRNPKKAYPTIIKLTARTVDSTLQSNPNRRGRPFVTRSKQVPFRGQELMEEANPHRQATLIQNAVRPLVQSLVLNNTDEVNVTRLNIAVTKFQDIAEAMDGFGTSQAAATTQQLARCMSQRPAQQLSQTVSKQQPAATLKQPPTRSIQPTELHEHVDKKQKVTKLSLSPSSTQSSPECTRKSGCGIDPVTLAELPPDMVKEIVRDYNMVVRNNRLGIKRTTTKRKAARIDHFFEPL